MLHSGIAKYRTEDDVLQRCINRKFIYLGTLGIVEMTTEGATWNDRYIYRKKRLKGLDTSE